MKFLTSALAVLLTAPVFGSDGGPAIPASVRVHEWGTFTSVAGASGAPQPWTSLAGPSDLPCFVYHLGNKCIKCAVPAPGALPPTLTSTVRMETPVLYFYSAHPALLSVSVDFPQGLITEWYPKASAVRPENMSGPSNRVAEGHIEWNNVAVSAGTESAGVTGEGASHYYAARNTDSQAIEIAGQPEKFIFYRGVANFPVPLWAKVLDETTLELRNNGDRTLPLAILFENRGGKVGYRITRELSGTTQLTMPELTADLDGLKKTLASTLVDMGLYPKEAQAMIETWRDSWFEEGMRVFYLMPRRSVDEVLPLTVKPAPASSARVFVGRVEVLSPFLRRSLETALATGDTATLAKYGRFVEPFASQILGGSAKTPATAAFFKARYDESRREFDSPSCVR